MHVFIIETILNGHHAGYFERIVTAYLDDGHFVTATALKCNLNNIAIQRIKSRYGTAFNIIEIDDAKYKAALNSMMGLYGREFALRRIFGQAYRMVNRSKPVDYVFLPYLDYCLYALGMLGSPFGPTLWGGICMRPSFHYSNSGLIAPKPKLARIKKFLFLRLLRNRKLKVCYSIDELLCRYVTKNYSQLAQRLLYIPDPAELKGNHSYRSGRQELGLSDTAIVILVYGAIDERKGLDILVDALISSDKTKNFHILVVGEQSESIQILMKSELLSSLFKEGRCHVINKFVDDEMQQMVFASSDVVWLGYRNHYTMSGVLVLAGMAGKPVISTASGLLGWYTKENNLGPTFDFNFRSDVVEALEKLINEGVRVECGINARNKFIDNNWLNFSKKILNY